MAKLKRPKDLIRNGHCYARAYTDAILKEPTIQLYWNTTRCPKAMRELGDWLVKVSKWAKSTKAASADTQLTKKDGG